jgi:hypothetical protein
MRIEILKIGNHSPVDTNKLMRILRVSKIRGMRESGYREISPEFLNQNELLITDEQLSMLSASAGYDFAIGLIERPLENNYFTRLVNENMVVVSTYDYYYLRNDYNLPIENFVYRFILAFALVHRTYGRINADWTELLHNNASGCLYDYSVQKSHIFLFFKNPSIDISVRLRLRNLGIDPDFLQSVEYEMKRLKVDHYQRLKDWMVTNPFKTALIAFFLSFFLHDLLGSAVFTWLSGFFG